MTFPRFPSIVLVRDCPDIFAVREVVATEKIHGSNFRIHFPLGMEKLEDIQYGCHEVEYVPGKEFPLGSSVQLLQKNPDLLVRMWETIKSYGLPNVTIFGEMHGPGIKSKGVKYSTGTEMLFRSFAMMVGENDNFVSYDLFCEITDKMQLDRVPQVWRGPPSMEAFDALLEKPSDAARVNGIDDPSNIAEGVVIQSVPLFRNSFGEWLMCKHKAKKFAEVAPPKPPKGPREQTPADAFAEMYVTEGRVRNAIGRLSDRGAPLEGTMKDMPRLLDEMLADLHKECRSECDAIFKDDFAKGAKGAVSRVLGPIYRQIISET